MKLFISIFLGAALSLSIAACDDRTKSGTETKKETVTTREVPENVKAALVVKYPGAINIVWDDADNDTRKYKARFELNGKKIKAEFDDGGVFIGEVDEKD